MTVASRTHQKGGEGKRKLMDWEKAAVENRGLQMRLKNTSITGIREQESRKEAARHDREFTLPEMETLLEVLGVRT